LTGSSLSFRWLGVAGVEIKAGGQILVIDPFFTRPPLRTLLTGRRVVSNYRLASEKLGRCDFILVTHPHWDHLMDVAAVMRHTGAVAYGSANTCKILAAAGIPAGQMRQVEVGSQESLGNFNVQVLPGRHIRTPLDGFINGAVRENLSAPLRLVDYKMDACFSLLVECGNMRFLFGNYPVRADILFINPNDRAGFYPPFIQEVQPKMVIPIHWDNFFLPLSRPIRPMLNFPAWFFPYINRNTLRGFKRVIETGSTSTRVIIPRVFDEYRLD
jgi:L-ascorbate metabolism protein UlaG (beta-lactamase superfamily)